MVHQEVALLDYIEQQETDLEAKQQELRTRQEAFGAVEEAWRLQVQARQEDIEECKKMVCEEPDQYVDRFE